MFGIDARVARIVWTVAIIAGLLYVLHAIRATLLVLVFAIFFSYLVYPLVQLTQRRVGPNVPRGVVVVIVFAVVLGAIVLAVTAFGARLADETARLTQQLPQLLDSSTLARRLPLPGMLEPFRERLAAFARELLQLDRSQALPAAQQIGSGVVQVATNLVYVAVVPILSFLIVMQAPAIKQQVIALSGRASSSFWVAIVEDMDFLMSRYVRALLLLSLATLLIYSVALTLFGAPFPLLLAGIAAVLEVIPVFGPLAAAIIILGVAAFSGYEHILWLFGFVVVYRIFQDYVLNPFLMSEGVEVSPILVVLGLLAGEELAGVAGIFLSVPCIAAVKIIISRIGTRPARGP